jgi:hypothetical protein
MSERTGFVSVVPTVVGLLPAGAFDPRRPGAGGPEDG